MVQLRVPPCHFLFCPSNKGIPARPAPSSTTSTTRSACRSTTLSASSPTPTSRGCTSTPSSFPSPAPVTSASPGTTGEAAAQVLILLNANVNRHTNRTLIRPSYSQARLHGYSGDAGLRSCAVPYDGVSLRKVMRTMGAISNLFLKVCS